MRTHDYPAKNAVRDMWMSFLAEARLDNIDRKTGLYLPAHQNLELKGYRTLGFSPAHLYGAERSADELVRVQKAAQGIQVIHGSVHEAVRVLRAREVSPLTFAYIDLEGSYHTHLHDLLSVFRIFPANPSGFLGVTSYAARDDDAISQGMINFSKFWSGMGHEDTGAFYRDVGFMMTRYRALCRHTRSRSLEHGHVSRELGFLWWLVIAMSFTHYDSNGFGTLDEHAIQEARAVLDRITSRMVALDRGTGLAYVTEKELGTILSKRNCELWPRSLVHIVHGTNSRQPMRTWFLEICRVPRKRDRYSAQEVLRQTWQLAVRAPLIYIDSAGTTLTIENRR